MSDPDVIWSYAKFDGARIFHKKPNIPDMPTEYRRVDLPPSDAEVMAHPAVKTMVEVMQRMADGWSNALELGIIAERHRTAATVLRDEARAALAAIQEAKP